jgi:hypothetical protein
MLQADSRTNKPIRKIPAAHPGRPVMTGLGALTILGVLLSPSPLVVLASGIVSIFLLAVLWRPGELPILLVPAYLQFIAVAMKPVTTAFTGTTLQDLADFDAALEPAALFGLAGIAVLVLGLRFGTGDAKTAADDAATYDWSFRRILALALVTILIGHALDLVAERSSGGRQALLALSGVKWAGLFVLAYSTLHLRRGIPWLAALVVIEIVMGMSGFFGEFRLVLFVLIGAAIAAHCTPRAGGIIALAVGAALTLLLAVFWSAVKQDYRDFLNQGTGAQEVLRPFDERIGYLVDKAGEFDREQFAIGFEELLARLSYIDFLASTMERVPEVLPHEGGAHLGTALRHVLTPRILFPDKPELPSDTLVTAHYTGVFPAVYADENTSISIGYLGELYIDFGIEGALLAVFLTGLGYGRCYRAIRDYPRTPRFINYGLCMMVALALTTFETALIKLIGSVVMILAVALVVQRLVLPVLLSSGHTGVPARCR